MADTLEGDYAEELGEDEASFGYSAALDIDDGIERDITIQQEVFGVVCQYGTEFSVMCFTLSNKTRDAIQVKVSSLGATMVSIWAPDRKGVYQDVILGFDCADMYYGPFNPGFGRITSLCPLPYNLEKIVWDWDFDRNDGSVTFSTAFYKIDLVLSVKYKLTTDNEIIVEMKACGAKILPISLTSQVYWNLAGHHKGAEAMKHHALSLNSDRIWKHHDHKLKNFISVNGTKLDFRIPTLMDNAKVFGRNNFEYVYVVSKGCEQRMSFLGRLIHPRTCRFLEIYSDQPWMLCNTLNKIPSLSPPCLEECWGEDGEHGEHELEAGKRESKKRVKLSSKQELPKKSLEEPECSEDSLLKEKVPGKENAHYFKYGSFCITPMSDLTNLDPMVSAGKHYSHTTIYKLGVYRRYTPCPPSDDEQEEGVGEGEKGEIVDIPEE